MSSRTWLRGRLENGPLVVVPGAANALAARVIEDCGFEAVYVSGAGIANTWLGAPDVGLVTLTELRGHVEAIRDAVSLPLIVDADTGFGNPVGVAHAVRTLERAGADAIQLEDQESPKRCGHFDGKSVVPVEEMVQKIRAATDARSDHTLMIIARTDARLTEGFEAAVERAARYVDAGADAAFVEAPQSEEEVRSLPRLLDAPQVINLVEGGRTPVLPIAELSEYRIALFANLALQAAIFGMQVVLSDLRDSGTISSKAAARVAVWQERQRLVRKPDFDRLEALYGGGGS